MQNVSLSFSVWFLFLLFFRFFFFSVLFLSLFLFFLLVCLLACVSVVASVSLSRINLVIESLSSCRQSVPLLSTQLERCLPLAPTARLYVSARPTHLGKTRVRVSTSSRLQLCINGIEHTSGFFAVFVIFFKFSWVGFVCFICFVCLVCFLFAVVEVCFAMFALFCLLIITWPRCSIPVRTRLTLPQFFSRKGVQFIALDGMIQEQS